MAEFPTCRNCHREVEFCEDCDDWVHAVSGVAACDPQRVAQPVDPLDAFRSPDGELVESEEFFAFVHEESVRRILSSGPDTEGRQA